MGGPEESQTLALRPGPPSSLGLEQPSSQVPGKQDSSTIPSGCLISSNPADPKPQCQLTPQLADEQQGPHRARNSSGTTIPHTEGNCSCIPPGPLWQSLKAATSSFPGFPG